MTLDTRLRQEDVAILITFGLALYFCFDQTSPDILKLIIIASITLILSSYIGFRWAYFAVLMRRKNIQETLDKVAPKAESVLMAILKNHNVLRENENRDIFITFRVKGSKIIMDPNLVGKDNLILPGNKEQFRKQIHREIASAYRHLIELNFEAPYAKYLLSSLFCEDTPVAVRMASNHRILIGQNLLKKMSATP
jgi:hypothetical protein